MTEILLSAKNLSVRFGGVLAVNNVSFDVQQGEVFTLIPGLVRKQATILLYGHGHVGVDLSVMNSVQFLEPTLVSPAGASGGHDATGRPLTYLRALRFIEAGTIDVASLITHRYRSLDAVPAAFAGDHLLPDYVKGIVLQ